MGVPVPWTAPCPGRVYVQSWSCVLRVRAELGWEGEAGAQGNGGEGHGPWWVGQTVPEGPGLPGVREAGSFPEAEHSEEERAWQSPVVQRALSAGVWGKGGLTTRLYGWHPGGGSQKN